MCTREQLQVNTCRANCQPVRGRNPTIYACIEEYVHYWLIHLQVPTLKDLKTSHHPEMRTLAQAIPNIIIQDRAPIASTVKKYASVSAWHKRAEARDLNVLPTSIPELACYLEHLCQTTKSLASIQAAQLLG